MTYHIFSCHFQVWRHTWRSSQSCVLKRALRLWDQGGLRHQGKPSLRLQAVTWAWLTAPQRTSPMASPPLTRGGVSLPWTPAPHAPPPVRHHTLAPLLPDLCSGWQPFWQGVTTEPDSRDMCADGVLGGARLGFAIDDVAQLDRAASKVVYSPAVEDAFSLEADGDEDGASRRRANAYSADQLKQRRARAMLGLGADAILMDFPEGHVPRQGQ